VRQQIERSGLSAAQIRQRLQAAGYSPALLDALLEAEGAQVSQVGVTAEMLAALDALGVPLVTAEGLEEVPVAVGLQAGLAPEEEGLQVFGLNVFRRPTTQFQPLLSGPVPPSYRIGAGDVLVLVLTGEVELIHELAVTREGYFVIPDVGQLFVANLTMEQLTTLLRRRLGQSYSGIRTGRTRFDVTVARLRTNQVYVVGEVTQPGAYQLASVATVLNGLYAAGGLTERANFRTVLVQRQGDTVAVLDLYEYLLRGDTRNDIVLEQGDVVFVPVRGTRVSITGAVLRPAIYEVAEQETLADVVRMAGGFRADAELRRLAVHRILPVSERGPGAFPRAVIDIPLATRSGPGTLSGVEVPELRLEDGDSVAVDVVIPFLRSLYVTITGSVNKPGPYPWGEGMTLRYLMLLARGPSVGADLREAEIARLPSDRSNGTLMRTVRVPMDSSYLFERDQQGRYVGAEGVSFPAAGTAPEVTLEPYDLVTIFSQPEFELQRSVKITGEVLFPGTYALTRKDERLSDLVSRAGGLRPTAHVAGGRFFRPFEEAGRVNIDLTLALEQPGGHDDIVLQPGDSLHLPEYVPTVRVEGAVNLPTSVLWEEDEGLEYYIGNAGGYARLADKSNVSVRYANGTARIRTKSLFFSSSPRPGPGSTILVPAKDPEDRVNLTPIVAAVAQILTATATLIIALTR